MIKQMSWYAKWFLALGGAALLWKLLKGNVRAGARAGVRWAMDASPAVRAFLKQHHQDIGDLLKEVEAGVDEGIKLEEAEDQQGTSQSHAAPQQTAAQEDDAGDAAKNSQDSRPGA